MMMQFLKEFLFPAFGVATVLCVAGVGIAWLFHVIHSISRAADALERIADVLECDEDDEEEEEEDNEEEGGVA